jgi:dipeptidyl-peptidase-4
VRGGADRRNGAWSGRAALAAAGAGRSIGGPFDRTDPRMRPTTILPLFLLAAFAAAQGGEPLTYADTRKLLQWQGPLPEARLVDGGKQVELLVDGKAMWFDPATGALAPKPDAAPASVTPAAPRKVVVVRDGDLWLEDAASAAAGGGRRRGGARADGRADGGGGDDGKSVRLTSDGAAAGKKEEAHLSADGSKASFVRGNDLYVVDVASKGVWRVTSDGGPERFHGLLDWVYQEELYGRGDFQGHWWNGDGSCCAWLSLDEAPVREFALVDHVPDGFLETERGVRTEVSNYPKAGDPNPFASLFVAHSKDQRIVPVDLSAYPKDLLVVRVDWTPDGRTLLATISDRIQTWAELAAIDPATGKATKWIREESPTWVNRPESPRWLPDGTFLWLSERTGYQHVYRYKPGGELVGAVTSGEWQVRAIERVDAARGLLWFEGTKDGATGRHLYRVGLDATGLVGLTPGVGTHQYELGDGGAFVFDRWSAMDMLPRVRVLDGATGAVLRDVGAAADGPATKKHGLVARQRATIKARDGYELDACLMLPPGRPADARAPVFLPTYSGPDAPTVRDGWQHSAYHQFLAQQGFVVLQVNVRTASGRGQVHTGACYKQLGVQELKDLQDAVAFVCKEHGGDPARVAISGWSYGGFISAYALTHSDTFALGLAGAGVYDWQLYDTIYTERYMQTPQQNPQGYAATSVIKAAKRLKGRLVLLHGELDDNVHLQNTMQLAWELQKAGAQDFELMVYPRSRHGLDPRVNAHSQEFQWLRLRQLLAPAAAK